jgi:regulator of replication initiation timing
MPASPLDYRTTCGAFFFVFLDFMADRVTLARKMMIRVVTLRRKSCDSVVLGCLLSYLFWCVVVSGDVELNPGPVTGTNQQSQPTLRQTRLNSRDRGAAAADKSRDTASPRRVAMEPTLAEIMAKLTQMDTSMDGKLSDLQADVQQIKTNLGQMQAEVEELREKVVVLSEENVVLEQQNIDLGKTVKSLEKKVDDLEGRSRRNNLLFYGIPRDPEETSEKCEEKVKGLINEKMALPNEVLFERVHRLSAKANSPVIVCCSSFRDKVAIMKSKKNLKGSDVFVGEDFSAGVREIRKALSKFMKEQKNLGKRVSMVFDHLIVDGEKMFLSEDGEGLVKRE